MEINKCWKFLLLLLLLIYFYKILLYPTHIIYSNHSDTITGFSAWKYFTSQELHPNIIYLLIAFPLTLYIIFWHLLKRGVIDKKGILDKQYLTDFGLMLLILSLMNIMMIL